MPPHSPHPTGTALIAAVRAAPADSLPRLVYADWLEEQNDPPSRLLAEYIRTETALAAMRQGDPHGSTLIHKLADLSNTSPTPLGVWEYRADLDRIRQKMNALRTADPTMALFGARGRSGHGYRLNPPIRETDLLRFEGKLGFLLPSDYRTFLLDIGNGPMGPYYGLTPLDLGRDLEPLRITFPFTREQAACAAAGPGCVGLTFADDGHDEGGYLHLCEVGCGIYCLLVIKGEAHGCVWVSSDVCELQLAMDGHDTHRAFLDWYEEWLDDSLKPETLERWRSLTRR